MSAFPPSTQASEAEVIGLEVDFSVIEGRNLKACDTRLFKKSSSDPYVVVTHRGKKILTTKTIEKNLNPKWNKSSKLHLQGSLAKHQNDEITFSIFDYDKMTSNDPMGAVTVKLNEFSHGQVLDKWFPVQPCKGCSDPKGELHVRLSMLKRHAINTGRGAHIPLPGYVGFCMGWEMLHGNKEIDLDTSIAAFDAKGNILMDQCIYYGNLRNPNNSIVHSGDEREGDEDLGHGDDERIYVNLATVPHHVAALFLIGTVATEKKSFADVKTARMRFVDCHSGMELCRFSPSLQGAHTALIMGRAVRDLRTGQWSFAVIGDSDHTARDFGTLIPELKSYLQDIVPGIRIDVKERIAIMRKNGASINLSDYCHPLPPSLTFGLAWDITKGRNIDLDASAILLDASLKQIDLVFFGKLRSSDGSIQHGGDEREGDEKGDDEKIFLNMPSIHPAVKYIGFVVNSYSGEELDDVSKASCHLFDTQTNRDLLVLKLSKTKFLDKKTALLMGVLYRDDAGQWGFKVIAEGAQGRTANDNVDELQRFLQTHPVGILPTPRPAPVAHVMPQPVAVQGIPQVQVVPVGNVTNQMAGVAL